MTTFYAKYPAGVDSTAVIDVVQGPGTAGVPLGGVLSIQGVAGGTAVTVSGTVTANNPSVGLTGAVVPTSATYVGMLVGGNLVALSGTANGLKIDGSAVTQPVSGSVSVTNFPATQPISGTVTANQGGAPWSTTVSGSVAVTGTFFQATQPVSGTFFQATQPVSGTVAVSNFPATQPVSGSVSVSSIVPVTTSAAVFQAEGSVAFGAITTSFVTLFTPAANTKILQMRNNMNQPVAFSFDNGTTTNYILDAGDQVSFDFLANSLRPPTTGIAVKYTGSAPTSGSARINGCA